MTANPSLKKVAILAADKVGSKTVFESWQTALGDAIGSCISLEVSDHGILEAYASGALESKELSGFDFIIFVHEQPSAPESLVSQLSEVMAEIVFAPSLALIDFAGSSSISDRASTLAFTYCTSFGLSCFMVRGDTLRDIGFVSSAFAPETGAVEEYTFRLLKSGMRIARSTTPLVTMRSHKHGSTKSQKHFEFAARYFVEHFGRDWDTVATSLLPFELQMDDFFRRQRQKWESELSDHEQRLYAPTLPVPDCKSGIPPLATNHHGIIRHQTIAEAIDNLHPWYYDLQIGAETVEPGIGSLESKEVLRSRRSFMDKMLVERLPEIYDFSDKHILDVGSNCGYFSATYAKAGARSLLAIEGRLQHVLQGRLYWGVNNFLKEGHYEFLHANIEAPETLDAIDARGPRDFILCAGLLYHLPNPYKVVETLIERAQEAILLDTRVAEESPRKTEPGGFSFDAIVETREKTVPSKSRLIALLESAGFCVQDITSTDPAPDNIPLVDNYTMGHRTTLFAQRQGA